MTIPIKKESKEMFVNSGEYENCFFCGVKTVYWHNNTNNPVCPKCSKRHKVSELPDYGVGIRAIKRKLKKK